MTRFVFDYASQVQENYHKARVAAKSASVPTPDAGGGGGGGGASPDSVSKTFGRDARRVGGKNPTKTGATNPGGSVAQGIGGFGVDYSRKQPGQ